MDVIRDDISVVIGFRFKESWEFRFSIDTLKSLGLRYNHKFYGVTSSSVWHQFGVTDPETGDSSWLLNPRVKEGSSELCENDT